MKLGENVGSLPYASWLTSHLLWGVQKEEGREMVVLNSCSQFHMENRRKPSCLLTSEWRR